MPQPLEVFYRREYRRIFATLVRLLGDFDLAEDALQDAFAVALQGWVDGKWPDNPRAWLISTARFKAIDRLRRQMRETPLESVAEWPESAPFDEDLDRVIEDDQLRLIFTCCHPALALEVQVALTLREVCGLTTEAIARAFILPAPTLAQRLVRGKSKIRTAGIPFELPPPHRLAERLDAVLAVIYLVFNEGARRGPIAGEADLTAEAIRLARLLWQLMPQPEVAGLLALLLLHQARRPARYSGEGEPVLLEAQDRSLWDAPLIEEGLQLVERALSAPNVGSFALQAAIAAVHAEAASAEVTDWPQIVALYDLLLVAEPSPVVELNRAVALAMRDGPDAGLAVIDNLLGRKLLERYAPLHTSRAELYRRLGRYKDARVAYELALSICATPVEHAFLQRRLAELNGPAD